MTSSQSKNPSSDIPRGLRIDNPEWDERTELLFSFIASSESIIEFGCGRQHMRSLLTVHSNYTPVDIERRSDDTIVCDLNSDTFLSGAVRFDSHDVAVFGGVLEYLVDVPTVIRAVARDVNAFVISYAANDVNHSNREELGWKNDYSLGGLINLFWARHVLYLTHLRLWRNQYVMRFSAVESA